MSNAWSAARLILFRASLYVLFWITLTLVLAFHPPDQYVLPIGLISFSSFIFFVRFALRWRLHPWIEHCEGGLNWRERPSLATLARIREDLRVLGFQQTGPLHRYENAIADVGLIASFSNSRGELAFVRLDAIHLPHLFESSSSLLFWSVAEDGQAWITASGWWAVRIGRSGSCAWYPDISDPSALHYIHQARLRENSVQAKEPTEVEPLEAVRRLLTTLNGVAIKNGWLAFDEQTSRMRTTFWSGFRHEFQQLFILRRKARTESARLLQGFRSKPRIPNARQTFMNGLRLVLPVFVTLLVLCIPVFALAVYTETAVTMFVRHRFPREQTDYLWIQRANGTPWLVPEARVVSLPADAIQAFMKNEAGSLRDWGVAAVRYGKLSDPNGTHDRLAFFNTSKPLYAVAHLDAATQRPFKVVVLRTAWAERNKTVELQLIRMGEDFVEFGVPASANIELIAEGVKRSCPRTTISKDELVQQLQDQRKFTCVLDR